MALRDRLRRLEGGMPDGCPTCVGLPPSVVYVNDPEVQAAASPTLPARCNRCGRKLLTIEVEYLDWPPNAVAGAAKGTPGRATVT